MSCPQRKLVANTSIQVLLVFGLIYFATPGFADSRRESLSTDQMLDYTLSDLRTRMQEMLKRNAQLLEKNEAMRKRMFSLQQTIRDLEHQKISLLEESVGLTDAIKVESKELSLEEQKSFNSYNYKDRFKEERARVQTQLDNMILQKQTLQEKMEDVKVEIGQFQEMFNNLKETKQTKDDGEKELLERSLKKKRINLQKARKKMNHLERVLANPIKSKNELFMKRGQLRKQVVSLKKSFKEDASSESVKAAAEESQEEINARRQLRDQIAELKGYQKELKETIKDVGSVEREVSSQFDFTEEQLIELKKLLEQENKLLLEKERGVRSSLNLKQDSQGTVKNWKENIEEDAQTDEYVSSKQQAKERARLQAQLEAASLEKKNLNWQVRSVAKEVEGLKRRVEPAPRGKSVDGRDKARLELALKRKKARLRQDQRKVDALERKLSKPIKIKNKLLAKQSQLIDQKITLEDDALDGAKLENELISKAASQEVSSLDDGVDPKIQTQVLKLREYRKNLKKAIDEISDIQEMVSVQPSLSIQQAVELQQLMDEENQRLLAKKSKMLTPPEDDMGVLDESITSDVSLDVTFEEPVPDGKTAVFMDEQTQIKKDIIETKVQQKLLLSEVDSLSREVEGFQQKLKESARKTEELRGRGQPGVIRELSQKSDKQFKRKQIKQDQVDRLQAEVDASQNQLSVIKVTRADLENKLALVGKEKATLLTTAGELEARGEELLQKKRPDGITQIEEDIEILNVRKSALANSISIIQSRFDADNLTARNFQEEEAELTEYLTILRRENAALKDKLVVMRDL